MPSSPASLQTIANYLRVGYWDEVNDADPRFFNISNAGVGANFGTLFYNVSGMGGPITSDFGNTFNDPDGLIPNHRELVRDAFDLYEEILGINFVETTSTSGAVDFFFVDDEGGNFAQPLTFSGSGGAIDVGLVSLNLANTDQIGSNAFRTVIHEIGHVLGLGHAGPYDGGGFSYAADANWENDSWQTSMMSYWSQNANTDVNASFARYMTPQAADLIALNDIYGGQDFGSLDFGTRNAFTGNTHWGHNTNISDVAHAAYAAIGDRAGLNTFTIIDGGGIDTVDFSDFNSDQRIDLTVASRINSTGTISNVGGDIGNMIIAAGTVIENARGGAGDDTLVGNDENNDLHGGAGSDNMIGGLGNDDFYYLSGLDGENDTLSGGAGHDRIVLQNAGFYNMRNILPLSINEIEFRADGQNVDKTVALSNGDFDTVIEFAGNLHIDGNNAAGSDDRIIVHLDQGTDLDISGWTFQDWDAAADNNDTLRIQARRGADQNNIISTSVADLIHARAGDDNIDSRDGADTVYGGDGNDTIAGGSGADSLLGGDHADLITGGNGNDTIRGGSGNDTMNGNNSDDRVYGDDGADWVFGGNGDDSLFGGNGNDWLRGDAGEDFLYAGTGDDLLQGGADDDYLYGDLGDDTLYGNTGDDVLNGNAGNDTLRGGDGNDTLWGNSGEDSIDGGDGADSLEGGGDRDTLAGGEGADTLRGGDGDDQMNGNEGNDRVYGDEGDDLVLGGAGADQLFGNSGDDWLRGDSGNDSLYAGVGDDLAQGGSGDDFLYGDLGEDTLDGNSGDDVLNGNAGNDVLRGGAGNDSLWGNSGEDVFDLNDGMEREYLRDFTHGEDVMDVADHRMTFAEIEDATFQLLQVVGSTEPPSVRIDFDGRFARDGDVAFVSNTTKGEFGRNVLDETDFTNLVIGEFGQIDSLTHTTGMINFQHTYEDPVVIVQSLSANGGQAAAVRLSDVTATGFSLFVQEPNHLDGSHAAEQVSYMVVEAGRWQLADGRVIEAGTFGSDMLTSEGFETVSFGDDFSDTPAVFSQVQSANDPDFVVTRQTDATAGGVSIAMQEEEALNGGSHGLETIGWVAFETGTGVSDGTRYEVGTSGAVFDHTADELIFNAAFQDTPGLVTSLASFNGSDPAMLRHLSIDAEGAMLRVQEDSSADGETIHVDEAISWFAFEDPDILMGTMLLA